MKTRGSHPEWILLVATFILITAAAAIFSCPLYRMVPLYVSLVVMLLQARANRLCFLIGGLNAACYAVVYLFLGLHGMALYSLCVAFPIQIVTFLRWRRHAYAQATVLRRLTARQRIGWFLGFTALWVVLYLLLSSLGSAYLILDNTVAIISTAGNLFSLLSLVEFPFIQIAAQGLNILLYSRMVSANPSQTTYLIYSVYAFLCAALSAKNIRQIYRQQNQTS